MVNTSWFKFNYTGPDFPGRLDSVYFNQMIKVIKGKSVKSLIVINYLSTNFV